MWISNKKRRQNEETFLTLVLVGFDYILNNKDVQEGKLGTL